MILTPAELEALTDKTERAQKRYSSQAECYNRCVYPLLAARQTLIVYRCFVEPHGQTEKEPVESPTVLL
jgi:hypothetical protein